MTIHGENKLQVQCSAGAVNKCNYGKASMIAHEGK